MMASEERTLEEELSLRILLADRVRKSVEEAESFKSECNEVGKHVDRLSQMLRSIFCLATSSSSSQSIYEHPVRRIVSDVSKNLERALTLVRKCKKSGVLRRVVTITSATDFRRLLNLIEASIGDLKWLLSVLDYSSVDSVGGGGGGISLSLPPIASNDPILAWVWSYIAAVQMGPLLDKVEAANGLASHALNDERNMKIIVEEGGIPPLLKLLKEGASPDGQIAAAVALSNLATDQERVRYIAAELGIPTIVQVLWDSPMRVQIWVANLVSRMAENDPEAQEEFAMENAIRPLVSLLSFEADLDDAKVQSDKPTSIHALVKYNKPQNSNYTGNYHHYPHSNSSYSFHSEGTSRGGHNKKDRENEKPEVKLKLKVKCAEALWLLSRGSVGNSQRITETKGLLCLANYIEKEKGELQLNCLMAVMEIASAAESNPELRQATFKKKNLAGLAVVDQLLRVIREEDNPSLQIPAIKSIGSLATAFSASETRVIGPLVTRLDHRNTDVATESIIALGKFVSPDNYLRVHHSKAIIEFGGVQPLVRLLRAGEHAQLHGLIVLCYLALHVSNSEALERARVHSALQGAVRVAVSQHPLLKELIPKAIYNLELYQAGVHPQTIF